MDRDGSRRALLLLCGVAAVGVVLFAWPASPISIVDDEPAPAELSVSSFERLETGCADDVATFARSSQGNGSYTRVSFVETGNETAALSARAERTSPAGASLRTFRVYVDAAGHSQQMPGQSRERTDQSRERTEQPRESSGQSQANGSCRMGVLYRIELSYDRGSSGGLLSGDDGTRVLWLENGAYSGCSASTSGSLDDECRRFTRDRQSDRTWANATATS